MRVLLIAYACEPGRGSEPGVGWNFAQVLSQTNEVHVLTRSNNREVVESQPSTVRWHYFDTVGRRVKRRLPLGTQVYHYIWQVRARRRVRSIVSAYGPFDYVQHLTLGSLRYPSAASVEGVTAIVGPVGGAETPPRALWRHLGVKGALEELVRAVANKSMEIDPLLRRSWGRASLGIGTTSQTVSKMKAFAPKLRVCVQPAIGVSPTIAAGNGRKPQPPEVGGPLRIVSVGRQEPWKGFALQLKIVALLRRRGVPASLTLLGTGKDRRRLVRISERLGITDAVSFIDRVRTEDDVHALLAEHHVFLFTSMREAGGMAVVEAMGAGLPSIAVAWGGPAVSLSGIEGALVGAGKDTVSDAADALEALLDRAHWDQVSGACRHRVLSVYVWDRRVRQVERAVKDSLGWAQDE